MSTQTWNIDTAHSSIQFTVRHMVISKVRGKFARWTGALAWEPGRPTPSSVEVKIEAASLDTGVNDRDNHLRSPDFLDVARFPEITFRSKGVVPGGEGRVKLAGELTIHGVTREVTLEVEEGGRGKDPWGGERAGFSARTHFDRKDFGLHWNQVLEAGGVLVGDRIDVEIEVEAIHAVESAQKTAAAAAAAPASA